MHIADYSQRLALILILLSESKTATKSKCSGPLSIYLPIVLHCTEGKTAQSKEESASREQRNFCVLRTNPGPELQHAKWGRLP